VTVAGTIYILCAEWCRVCRELKLSSPPSFDYQIIWIDIDRDEDFLEGLDFDNLPTIAVNHGGKWSFWGTAEPLWKHIFKLAKQAKIAIDTDTLDRLSKMEDFLRNRTLSSF